MHFALASRPLSIAVKLYCVAAFTAAAVGALTLASIHFAKITQISARSLYEDGFVGVENSTRLEVLIEQHRRIVQSAPADVDRERLAKSGRDLDDIGRKMREIVGSATDPNGQTRLTPLLAQEVERLFPNLFSLGQQTLLYAYQFATDRSARLAEEYATVADEMQEQIHAYRKDRLSIAENQVSDLYLTANALMRWVFGATMVIFLLMGPSGLIIMHDVLVRLRRIADAMIRLAQRDTAVEVPSLEDRDEVGDMARAAEVFKATAIEVLEKSTKLEQANFQLDVALNNMAHGLCMFDAKQRLIVCNERYARLYQLPPALTKPGVSFRQVQTHRMSVGNEVVESVENGSEASGAEGAEQVVTQFTEILVDGRTIAVSRQRLADGATVAVHEDITERRRADAQIAHLARHDSLTNLPNRVQFREQLAQALTQARRGKKFAVLLLDLDRFKAVNDSLGHSLGDALLQEVAQRLRKTARETDTVARLGGDEFAVVQVEVNSSQDTDILASRLVEVVSAPYQIGGHSIVVGVSIGLAIAPLHGADPDTLLKNADLALYLAKAEGRGIYRFFRPEMDTDLKARRVVESDLRRAIANNEFELYYQPIVDLKLGYLRGFEALLRWNHPERGVVSAGEFISIAEDAGLIVPIGEWTLRRACSEAALWPADIHVAVNLSPAHFKTQNLVQVVFGALAFSRLAPNRLELEITESVLMEDDERTVSMLHQLRSFGVKIAMDDFGKGFSSLSYLHSFPFDKIKIDQSFTRDLGIRADSAAIIRAIATLGDSLGITTVAEGLETAEQVKRARAEGCIEGQGYFFSPAVPVGDIGKLLARSQQRVWHAA